MSKPVLIFTPGAWHSPEVFGIVISKLTALGYRCIALPLLAVGQKPAVRDLQPDIAAVREAVLRESDAGNDVMMVAHSWSGIVVADALEGLSKAEREKNGGKGGVVKLAFMCAFVPSEHVSLIDAFGGQIPEFYDIKEPWVTVKSPETVFYHDLGPEQQAYWTSRLQPHSYATKFVGATMAAWRTIPSAYLICEDDRAIPVAVQEAMVKNCQDAGAPMETERIFTSHSPFLSKPDDVVGFLRRAVGEKECQGPRIERDI
ncbi:MAG: hypothetical protein M1818_002842 [Claussenomyces sp. TS43310]|nr:MAG: hypothetical protein M1818_002842 [Claussenomyces sp. TS43310]